MANRKKGNRIILDATGVFTSGKIFITAITSGGAIVLDDDDDDNVVTFTGAGQACYPEGLRVESLKVASITGETIVTFK